MRDDFSSSVKRLLAERAGFRCSNPNCQQVTSGPSENPNGSVNIGVAAHITAASPGGPRYNAKLSKEDRKNPENGIWLCQNCAKLIDSDPQKYSSTLLYTWKSSADVQALNSIQGRSPLTAGLGAQASVVVLAQLDQIATRLSGEIEQRLERMRMAWREGRKDEAIKGLSDLKSDVTLWLVLSPEVKAQALCLEASWELHTTGNVVRARQLADEALALAPSHNQARLRALIARKEIGPEATMRLLEGQEDIDSLHLKASLLLEMGLVNDCLAMLNFEDHGLESNDET